MAGGKKAYARKMKKRGIKNRVPRKYVAKKQSEKSITSIVKKVLHKETEVKHHDFAYPYTELYHNNYATGSFKGYILLSNTNQPASGVGENQMIGSEYKVIGSHLYMQFLVKNDRMNTKFRVLILRIPSNVNPTTYADLFDPITANVMLDPLDHGRCQVLFDKIFGYKNIVPNNATDEVTFHRKIWVPKQKYTVKQAETGSSTWLTPKFVDLIVVMAYDSYGSLITDNIGAVQIARRLYYTDT